MCETHRTGGNALPQPLLLADRCRPGIGSAIGPGQLSKTMPPTHRPERLCLIVGDFLAICR
jgi:hypothetical protein